MDGALTVLTDDMDQSNIAHMAHMKVVRVIVYEGEEEWVRKTLARSFVEGTHQMTRGTLQVLQLENPELLVAESEQARMLVPVPVGTRGFVERGKDDKKDWV